jgi:hypothetical protein
LIGSGNYGSLVVSTLSSDTVIAEVKDTLNTFLMTPSMSWFPGGDRIAYVRNGTPGARWEVDGNRVEVLDLERKQTELIGEGDSVLVSSTGKTLLFRADGRWRIHEVESRKSRAVRVRGMVAPLGLVDDKLLVYWGIPTDGAPAELTRGNSPLVGPKRMLAIKVANLETGGFETIRSSVDPRSTLSFAAPVRCGAFRETRP